MDDSQNISRGDKEHAQIQGILCLRIEICAHVYDAIQYVKSPE